MCHTQDIFCVFGESTHFKSYNIIIGIPVLLTLGSIKTKFGQIFEETMTTISKLIFILL